MTVKSNFMRKTSFLLLTYKKLLFRLYKAITPNSDRISKNQNRGPPRFIIFYHLKQKISKLVHWVKSYYKSTVVLKGVLMLLKASENETHTIVLSTLENFGSNVSSGYFTIKLVVMGNAGTLAHRWALKQVFIVSFQKSTFFRILFRKSETRIIYFRILFQNEKKLPTWFSVSLPISALVIIDNWISKESPFINGFSICLF